MVDRKITIGPLSPASTDKICERSKSTKLYNDNQHLALRDLEAQGLAGTGDFLGEGLGLQRI